GSCLTWRIEPAPRDFGAGDPEWKYDHAVVDEATPGRMIVSGYGLPAQVWEAARGSVVGPVYLRADEEGQAARPLHGAVLRAWPSLMAVVDGESVSLLKRASGHVVGSVHAHGFEGGAFLRAIARGGARLLHAWPSSHRALVHDPTDASQRALAELSVEGTGGITALAFADEAGSLVLLGCADGTLRRYRIPDTAGRDGRPLPVAGVTLVSVGAVRSLACMEHQGALLALVGDTTGKVQCVDVERAAVVRTLDAGADAVVEIVTSRDGSRFFTRTGGGSIRLWDVGGTCTGACVEPTARALVLGAEVVGMIDALGQLVVLEPSSVPSPAQNT
ncbi:MAG TPA: hypothetical protein VM694_41245, partial [Polyangium sp.]|nr:hypothetical protein [Polyangium sp.]